MLYMYQKDYIIDIYTYINMDYIHSYFKDYIVYFKPEVSTLLETLFSRFISSIDFKNILWYGSVCNYLNTAH